MKEDVIHPLVNEKTWERVEDTLPQLLLQVARKVAENVEVKDGRLGAMAAVSEWDDNYQIGTGKEYHLRTTLNMGFIAACGSIRSVGG